MKQIFKQTIIKDALFALNNKLKPLVKWTVLTVFHHECSVVVESTTSTFKLEYNIEICL